jgi:hypothetical protein
MGHIFGLDCGYYPMHSICDMLGCPEIANMWVNYAWHNKTITPVCLNHFSDALRAANHIRGMTFGVSRWH